MTMRTLEETLAHYIGTSVLSFLHCHSLVQLVATPANFSVVLAIVSRASGVTTLMLLGGTPQLYEIALHVEVQFARFGFTLHKIRETRTSLVAAEQYTNGALKDSNPTR